MKAVFTVVQEERLGRPLLRRVGSGFVNGDGSISVVLDALPLSGRLVIRDIDLRPEPGDLHDVAAYAPRPASPAPHQTRAIQPSAQGSTQAPRRDGDARRPDGSQGCPPPLRLRA